MEEMQNDSYWGVNTSGGPVLGTSYVSLWVVLWCAVIIVLVLFGILLNLAVLLSSRCKRSVCSWQYGLTYNVCAVNLAACLVWLPVCVTQILGGFLGRQLHVALCYVNVCLFHMCSTVAIISVLFVGIMRLLNLSPPPSAATTSHSGGSAGGTVATPYHINNISVAGVCASWVVGVLVTLYMAVGVPGSLLYEVCNRSSVALQPALPRALPLPAVSLPALLVVAITALLLTSVAVALQRHYSSASCGQTRTSKTGSGKNCSYQPVEMKLDSVRENTSSRADGPSEVGLEPHRHITSAVVENSTITKDSTSSSSAKEKPDKKQKLMFAAKPDVIKDKYVAEEEGGEEDDDTFDMKMRLKMRTSSGRRHTVANIGGNDNTFQTRRGSLGDTRNNPSTNYQYVRKWSVDIVALQNQLENPKTQGSSNPFQGLDILQEKEKAKEAMAEAKDSTLGAKRPGSKSPSLPRSPTPSFSEANKTDNCVVANSSKQRTSSDGDDACAEEQQTVTESTDLLSPMSDRLVMTPESPASNTGGSATHTDKDFDPFPFNSPSPPKLSEEVVAGEEENSPLQQQLTPVVVVVHTPDNGNNNLHVRREVVKMWKCVLLEFVTLMCYLPFTLVCCLAGTIPPRQWINAYLGTTLFVCLYSVAHPLLLIWIESRLCSALRRLHTKLTHWRCVCYCNIGKGRQCFGQPSPTECTTE